MSRSLSFTSSLAVLFAFVSAVHIASPEEWAKSSSDGRYKVSSEGVIRDTKTGLEWLVGPDADTTYAAAEEWVRKQNVAGGGWRMPTQPELKRLYQEGKGTRNMDPVFVTTGWWVWAEPKDKTAAWVYDFHYGEYDWHYRTSYDQNRAFAVRSTAETDRTHQGSKASQRKRRSERPCKGDLSPGGAVASETSNDPESMRAEPDGALMQLSSSIAVDGKPLLGAYACSNLDDLQLAKRVGMNLVLGGHELLDASTPEGRFVEESGLKVMVHLTEHLYGMPALGAPISPDQVEIPLSSQLHRPLPDQGIVLIGDELVRYATYTPQALKGCERGAQGTQPSRHHEGIFLFSPEACRKDIESVKDSPVLWGYYVLDDSPGDALSALRGIYRTVCEVEGKDKHHPVCAGYGSPGSLANFGPGVCDLMMIYWYPISGSGYHRNMISDEVQWMLTAARARVPGIWFVGVYQAFWGEGAGDVPAAPQQIREQMEDFTREGAVGVVSFACRMGGSFHGWNEDASMQEAMKAVHEEILSTKALRLSPEPDSMASARIQPTGQWQTPNEIHGLVPAWLVIGPFDDPQQRRLARTCPPDDAIDLSAVYPGKYGTISWVRRESQAGVIGLVELFPAKHAVAYATCTLIVPKEMQVRMRFGSDDDAIVWIGEKEVYRYEGVRGVDRNEDAVPVTLPAGSTRLLVKICNREGMWGFFVQFVDRDGGPIQGLHFEL